MINISHKQYILSSCRLCLENMQEYSVAGNFLYVDEKLSVCQCLTHNNHKVFLIGNAFCTYVEGKSAKEDIASFSGENIEEITRFWTGRWALITEKEVITDAASLMSAFCFQDDGKWLVSSSLALISKVLGTLCEGEVTANGISHIILPKTLNKDVKKLIPGYKIVFGDDGIRIEFTGCFTDKSYMTTEEKCKAIAEMLCTGLKNINTFSQRKIILALTGGKDSRLTFAALLKAGVPFSCYTAEHKNISSSDKYVPKRLCKIYNIPYIYIKSKPLDKEKLMDYKEFTAGNSKGADEEFYARGQFDEISKNSVVIRSGIFEAAQTYNRGISDGNIENFSKDIIGYFMSPQNSELQAKGLEEWIETVRENPLPFVDIRDRYYIEQRVGGWASAIEQSLDMNDFVSIQIANCTELISVLLSANIDERKNLSLAYGTIKYLYPEVLEVEINKRTFADKLHYIGNILKSPKSKFKNFFNKHKRR